MDRIELYSEDRALLSLLSSAFGNEFLFQCEPCEPGFTRSSGDQKCHVALLEITSRSNDLDQRIECAYRLIGSGKALVILADAQKLPIANDLLREGAFGVCQCPPSMRELRLMLHRAAEQGSSSTPRSSSPSSPNLLAQKLNMVGSGELIEDVYHTIERVADADASVLIAGESGTGKELVARGIHNLSSRKHGPFVAVSFGAIPETLIEAELFGHEKGAFTGTVGDREGLLEKAGEGTLFLDEIGELSLFTQIKLLRVLQEREFSRLGCNRILRLRARLLFATHRNLDEMVALGRFRQDLYFRINIVKIEIPPLRDHAEDIPELAAHFLRRYSKSFHKPTLEFTEDAMSLLQKYPWPGNVRELENLVQHMIVMAPASVVDVEDLPWKFREPAFINTPDVFQRGSFEDRMQEFRVKLAVAAVREKRGNKAAAARSLNISRGYLHRLIRAAEPDAGSAPSESMLFAADLHAHS